MNLFDLQRALRQLRLGGIAEILETRLHQAQTESMTPIDLVSRLVSDELDRRSIRLLERRRKQARFRDPQKTLDSFDFTFNKKMNRSLVFDLATGAFISRHDDALFLGPPGTGKSHLAQAIGLAAIEQGYRVVYRETHALLDDIAEATIDGTRKECMEALATVPLLIIDDLGMRKLPPTAAEELLEIVMRRYERTSTLLTSNRPVQDWGKLLGDSAAVTAMLDWLLHHGHILKCGPRSWRTKTGLPSPVPKKVEQHRPGPSPLAGFEVTTEGHPRRPCRNPAPSTSVRLNGATSSSTVSPSAIAPWSAKERVLLLHFNTNVGATLIRSSCMGCTENLLSLVHVSASVPRQLSCHIRSVR